MAVKPKKNVYDNGSNLFDYIDVSVRKFCCMLVAWNSI